MHVPSSLLIWCVASWSSPSSLWGDLFTWMILRDFPSLFILYLSSEGAFHQEQGQHEGFTVIATQWVPQNILANSYDLGCLRAISGGCGVCMVTIMHFYLHKCSEITQSSNSDPDIIPSHHVNGESCWPSLSSVTTAWRGLSSQMGECYSFPGLWLSSEITFLLVLSLFTKCRIKDMGATIYHDL